MTNEQIEVLRHLATTFGHIGDEDESVAAIKAAISLAERVRDGATGWVISSVGPDAFSKYGGVAVQMDGTEKHAVGKRVALVVVE